MKRQMLIVAFGIVFLGSANLIFAQTTGSQTRPTTGTALTPPTLLSCVWNAVEKREQSISAAFSEKATTVQAALTQRTVSLKAAWSTSDKKERGQLIQTAWKTFKASIGQSKKTQRGKVLSAWKIFTDEKKKCGSVETPGESSSLDTGL